METLELQAARSLVLEHDPAESGARTRSLLERIQLQVEGYNYPLASRDSAYLLILDRVAMETFFANEQRP